MCRAAWYRLIKHNHYTGRIYVRRMKSMSNVLVQKGRSGPSHTNKHRRRLESCPLSLMCKHLRGQCRQANTGSFFLCELVYTESLGPLEQGMEEPQNREKPMMPRGSPLICPGDFWAKMHVRINMMWKAGLPSSSLSQACSPCKILQGEGLP